MSAVIMMQRAWKYFSFIESFNTAAEIMGDPGFQELDHSERLGMLREFRDIKEDYYFGDHGIAKVLGAAQSAGKMADAHKMSITYCKKYF